MYVRMKSPNTGNTVQHYTCLHTCPSVYVQSGLLSSMFLAACKVNTAVAAVAVALAVVTRRLGVLRFCGMSFLFFFVCIIIIIIVVVNASDECYAVVVLWSLHRVEIYFSSFCIHITTLQKYTIMIRFYAVYANIFNFR